MRFRLQLQNPLIYNTTLVSIEGEGWHFYHTLRFREQLLKLKKTNIEDKIVVKDNESGLGSQPSHPSSTTLQPTRTTTRVFAGRMCRPRRLLSVPQSSLYRRLFRRFRRTARCRGKAPAVVGGGAIQVQSADFRAQRWRWQSGRKT